VVTPPVRLNALAWLAFKIATESGGDANDHCDDNLARVLGSLAREKHSEARVRPLRQRR